MLGKIKLKFLKKEQRKKRASKTRKDIDSLYRQNSEICAEVRRLSKVCRENRKAIQNLYASLQRSYPEKQIVFEEKDEEKLGESKTKRILRVLFLMSPFIGLVIGYMLYLLFIAKGL